MRPPILEEAGGLTIRAVGEAGAVMIFSAVRHRRGRVDPSDYERPGRILGESD